MFHLFGSLCKLCVTLCKISNIKELKQRKFGDFTERHRGEKNMWTGRGVSSL
jgi:Fe-S-cluster-containing dehydrogenase component